MVHVQVGSSHALCQATWPMSLPDSGCGADLHRLPVLLIAFQGASPFLYRDTKPDNVTFDPSTGQVKLIDFGLAMHLNGCDHIDGFTVSRFTPEMVDPAGGFRAFLTPSGRFMSLNKTTDVFLTGQQGLEMIQGLPQQLQPCP